jgi:hypothetical protein
MRYSKANHYNPREDKMQTIFDSFKMVMVILAAALLTLLLGSCGHMQVGSDKPEIYADEEIRVRVILANTAYLDENTRKHGLRRAWGLACRPELTIVVTARKHGDGIYPQLETLGHEIAHVLNWKNEAVVDPDEYLGPLSNTMKVMRKRGVSSMWRD